MHNVSIIGAGTMGKRHLLSWTSIDSANVKYQYDIRKDIVKQLVDGRNIIVSDDFENVLKDDEVDIVDVCVPTYLHKRYAIDAMKAHKNVFCEKPLSLTVEDSLEIIKTAEKHNVKFMVGQVVRFFPQYANAKKAIERGEIGNPAIARFERLSQFPHGWNDWYADFTKSKGLIFDMSIHDIDFARWCFGDVERIYAKTLTDKKLKFKEHALITMRMKNGVMVHIEGSWARPSSFTYNFEIVGTNGMIDFNSERTMPILKEISNNNELNTGVQVPESPLKLEPYAAELKHFLDIIDNGVTPIVSPYDAAWDVKLALLAIKSAEQNKVIEVGEKL